MSKRRFLIAIITVLLSTIIANADMPSEKYASWLPSFKIDKVWQFDPYFIRYEDSTTPLYKTSFVDIPGHISWSIKVRDVAMLHLSWAEIWLVNSSDSSSIQLVKLYFDSSNQYGPSSITQTNGCTTAQTNYKYHITGNYYQYYHTLYGSTVKDFIVAAGSNLKVKVHCSNLGMEYTSTSTLDPGDRQQITLPQPNVSDVQWEVQNNTTCVSFKPGVDATNGLKLKIEEYTNANAGSEYQSFSSGSKCFYHPSQLTSKKNYLNSYSDYFKFKIYTEKTYSYSKDYFYNYQLPTTTTIKSETFFNAPAFAQPRSPMAVDNKDGSVTLTWSNPKHTSDESYDNSIFKVERATNSDFTENNVTYNVNFTYQTGEGSTNYDLTDSFNIRDQGNKTFYYRIYREHAEKTELNCTTSTGVNTNYATLGNFEATIDSATNYVNLRWNYNAGIKNSELKLRIEYDNTTIVKNSSDAETTVNGLDNFRSCVPTRITAQLYANNTEYGLPISVSVTAPSSESGIIDTVIASAGYFNDRVNITWTVNRTRHNFSDFQLVRKIYGDSVETPLTNVSFASGIYNYSYTDNTCVPGVYYTYKLKGFAECNGTVSEAYSKVAIGFAQPYGVVSGQIAYSGNQAVENVAVVAQCEDIFNGKSVCLQAGYHPKLEIPSRFVSQMLSDAAGTIEFFVRLDNVNTNNPIVKCGDKIKLYNQNGKLRLSSGSNSAEVDNALSAGTFSHIAITYDNQNVTLFVNGNTAATVAASQQTLQSIVFGSDQNTYMTGYLDEIRAWNTTRTQQDIQRYMDSYLNGNESGLTVYYRCDDDICIELFDISKNTNNFNGRHISISGVTFDGVNIPTAEQLGHKAYTNQYGNYLFNNIPYSVNGTLYNVIPMLGIHEFSPAQRPLFFNSNAVTHNAVDFEDVSCFPVSGKVTFANTNYPVEGCQFYIDGTTLCTSDGEPVETNAEGEYTISVPIGEHYITVKKDGHTFVNNGRYPATGRLDFQNAVTNLTFQDSTFVLVTGRVAGGSDEEEKPHGFGIGNATIGQARITLGTRGDLYNLNLDEVNGRTFTMPTDSLHGSCSSVATTGRAYQRLAHDITILTDPRTGEFNVMLPPIDFEVKNVELIHNDGNITFNLSSISGLSLGSQVVGSTTTDSLLVDSTEYNYFSYSAALDVIHYVQPTMTLQQNAEDMALGSPSLVYENSVLNITDTVPLYTIDTLGNITYKFGYPCFAKDDIIDWKITAYETYVNYDTQDTTRQPFRYGIVSVANNFGTQVGNDVAMTDTTITTSDNDVVYVSGDEMMLDSSGTTYYSFQVDEPNVMPPFTSTFTISYQDGQRTRYYDWDGNSNERNKVIVLGAKITGTNFVTKGPDEIFYILRAPLGSGSSATWQKGATTTKIYSTTKEFNRETSEDIVITSGVEAYAVEAPGGVGTVTHTSAKVDATVVVKASGKSQWKNNKTWKFTNTQTVSTSLKGSKGDLFIGVGTNRLYGDARNVCIHRDTAGNYSINVEDALSVSTEFLTQFNYSQDHIVKNLMPNLKRLRNQLLTQVPASQYDTSFVNSTDAAIYITTLAETDPNYGENGTYLMIFPDSWKNDPNDKRVFEDEVYSYNNQIRRWRDALIHNERCKVIVHNSSQLFDSFRWNSLNSFPSQLDSADLAGDYLDRIVSRYKGGWLKHNYSLGTKGNISCSETDSYSSIENGFYESDGFQVGLKKTTSTTINSHGVKNNWSVMAGFTGTTSSSTEDTETSTVSYNVSIGRFDALSFDVYQAPDGYGPIFAVRGGQTSCPYHAGEWTKFYEPGQHEIQTTTTPTFFPQLTASNPEVNNVPIGKKALFNLDMANIGTAYGYTYFNLRALAGTNPNSAILKIDGENITNEGILFSFSKNQSLSKILELTPVREDILDYDSIALVLMCECEFDDADTVWISAHFVQSCSDIDLRADKTIVNNTTGNTVTFTIDGFEQDFRNLSGIQLQYQSAGSNQWSLLKQFPADSAAVIHYSHTFTKPQYPDGTYKFRAVTLCQFGNETINNESEEVAIVVDVAAPEALGQPYPLDGIYTANNQIYVDFNEPIQSGRILSDNVLVEGVLNAHEVDHSVALSLENNTAMSNATYNLGTTPFTIEMWLNYSKPGTIFSYAGGGTNGIEFAIDADNKLVATINGTSYKSTAAMLPGRWLYLVIQCDAANNQFAVTYAYDDQNVTLFHSQGYTGHPAASGNIRFGGNGINAKIHEIALWKSIRTTAESLLERNESKSSYTPDIVSLWHCDEGKGNTVADIARQRNLTLTDDAWAYSHVNYAMHVAAGKTALVNISECPMLPGKSYLYEMWFRASGDAELFHLDNNAITVSISNGNLVLNSQTLPIRNYQDNVWHHLAIIKPNISTPVIAIDGKQLPSPSLNTLPAFAAGTLVLGNAGNTNDIDIDEIRLWNINTTLDATRQRMGSCMKGDESGLVAYYPMEAYVTDPITSQISTEFTLADKTNAEKVIVHSDATNAQSSSVPALLESRPIEYVAHTHTASEERVVVNVTEQAQRIEGCWLEITVKDIVDANGNYSEPIRWTVFVNRNQLLWDRNSYTIVKDEVEDTTFNLTIVNNSSVIQNWSIDNVPACMTLSETSGHIQPLQTKTVTCTIDATAEHGETEHTLYLNGNENMDCPLYITTKVYANKPDWNINPNEFEYSMSIIGYVEVNGAIADDDEDMMAAFVDGTLAGVANLRLLPAMGRYFVMMTIYQNDETVSGPKDITFRYWDASTGIVYSDARLYLNGSAISNLKYQTNNVLGSINEPLRIVMGDEIEQVLELSKRWNWVSFNVEPAQKSINSIMTAYIDDFSIIKSQNGYAQPDRISGIVYGNIGDMDCKTGYKVKAKTPFDLHLAGFAASLDSVINLKAQQWTWFGFLPQKAMTVNAAMSNINPTVGDIVKSKSQFATWDGYQWIGSLEVMRPGQGYVYRSYSSDNISFTYPDFAGMANLMPAERDEVLNYFDPIDPGMYQGNMNVTAVVHYNGEEVTTAEIGVFAGSECRAAATCNNGFYFITVPGDSAVNLTVKVVYNDSIYTLQGNMTYRNDAIIGSVVAPLTIELTAGVVPDSPTDDDGEPLTIVSVEAVKDAKVEKVLIDNEVFIIRDGKMYDMLGRPRK